MAPQPLTEVTQEMFDEMVDARIEQQLLPLTRSLAEGNRLHWDNLGGSDIHTKRETDKLLDFVRIDCALHDLEDPFKSKLAQDPNVRKALDSTIGGSGLEWSRVIWSSSFWSDVENRLVVASAFAVRPMESKTLTVPAVSGTVNCYLQSENTDPTAPVPTESSPTTSNVSFSAKRISARTVESNEAFEDNGTVGFDAVRSKLIYSVARSVDQAVLDGDTAATHMDSAAVGATDPRKAWIGLRKHALDNGPNVDLSTFTLDALAGLPAGMDAYSEDLTDLCWIMNSRTFFSKIVTMKDSSGNAAYLPASNAGAMNPLVTGKIGYMLGIELRVSGIVRNDLSAYGYYSAAGGYTQNKSVLHLVNKRMWELGVRKDMSLETERSASTGTTTFVCGWRGQLQRQNTTSAHSVIGLNLST